MVPFPRVIQAYIDTQIMQTSYGYILKYFVTKLCKLTNFKMFFLAVLKDLPRSKFNQLWIFFFFFFSGVNVNKFVFLKAQA